MAELLALSVAELAIDWRYVKALLVEQGLEQAGFRGGPIVGRALRSALERVIDDPTTNRVDALRRTALREAANAYGAPEIAPRTVAFRYVATHRRAFRSRARARRCSGFSLPTG
ncbi:hypothetical protein EPN42_11140 [bacterium]|nr:MAG: hypothetical protein EPN42_11140 [bacterium]